MSDKGRPVFGLCRFQSGRWRVGAMGFVLLFLGVVESGCAVREQVRRVCIGVEASENLNFYGGKANSLTLLIYPLADDSGFLNAPVSELFSGHRPSGVLEPPVPITVEPAEKMDWEQVFPAATRAVGILADYDREPGVEGQESGLSERRVVVPARCGFMKPRLKLLERRIGDS
ncbi:MAG: hypothetical protein CMN75_00525 [Spirochaeta sp.]|nr:hypothetical protein [Spirochaeta sp.]RPG08196.1 MAG: hypothetical protein CBC32_008315 [Proteobacteria bacterium TMED72]